MSDFAAMTGLSEELWDAHLDDGAGDPILDATEELAADVARCRAAAAALAQTLRRLGVQRALDGVAAPSTNPAAPSSSTGDLQLRLELLCRDARAAAAATEQCAAAAALVARRAATFQQQVARATAMNRLAYAKLCAVVRTETRQHASSSSSSSEEPREGVAPQVATGTATAASSSSGATTTITAAIPTDPAPVGHVIVVRDLLSDGAGGCTDDEDDEDAAARDQLLSDVGKHILSTELQADGSAASLDDDERASCGGSGGGESLALQDSGGSMAGSSVGTDALERTSAAILGNASVLEALLGLSMDTLSVGGATCRPAPAPAPEAVSAPDASLAAPATATKVKTKAKAASGTAATPPSPTAGKSARTCAVRDVAVQTDPLRTADLCQMIEHSVASTEQCTLQ